MVLLVLGFKLFEPRVVGSVVDLRLGFRFQTVLKCMVISRSSNKTCSDVFLFAVYFHCVSTPKASKHDDHDDHVTHEFFFVRGYIVKQVICLVLSGKCQPWKLPWPAWKNCLTQSSDEQIKGFSASKLPCFRRITRSGSKKRKIANRRNLYRTF